jgi:hypothetical protein
MLHDRERDPSDGWMPADTAPDGVEVETKIDDKDGVRNECTLTRKGNLWWIPNGAMYVYYAPTHWRPLKETPQQWHARAEKAEALLRDILEEADLSAAQWEDEYPGTRCHWHTFADRIRAHLEIK